MRIWARLMLAGLLVALAAPAPALAAPELPISHSGRWIVDAAGRVVVVHGINMVYKLPPYYPAAAGFGEDDARFLSQIGFNVVRVGVLWKALEPHPGVYDQAYLKQIVATVRTLRRHGLMSLLDFHQDLLNERFQGEGAPDWAIQDGGLPNPKDGFPGNYLANPALQHALDAFWRNAPGPGAVGLQVRYARAWERVAETFRSVPGVLGYELFNEPFPGTAWEQCASPSGCPLFDQQLTAFTHRVTQTIRLADRRTLVWYEPNVLFNNGADTQMGPVGDLRSGFAFHDYCLSEPQTGSPAGCDGPDDLVFQHAVARAQQSGDAVLESEYGATDDTAYLSDMVRRGDRFMVPWTEWAYCGCHDPTTSGPGDKQAIVRDPTKPPAGANLVLPSLHALVEPYPQVVAGTPLSWGFTSSTRVFTLRYNNLRPGGDSFAAGTVSEVSVPALVYHRRYAVQVQGGRVVSRRGASLLQVASCPGAHLISLSVSPTGRTRGGCSPPVGRRRRHHPAPGARVHLGPRAPTLAAQRRQALEAEEALRSWR